MNNKLNESIHCPLCRNSSIKPAFGKFNYSFLECQSCSSLFVYPIPSSSELEAFYTSPDVQKLSQVCWNETAESHRHVWGVWQEALNLIEKLAGKGVLLDVGCGTGQFLQFARRKGWQRLEGIELVPEIAERARSLSDAKIYTSTLLKADLPSHYYSGIVLWDIVEHLNDVESILQEVYRLLKPGGILLIGTVNRHGLSLRYLGVNALTVNPPEHILFFSARGMKSILELTGFRVYKLSSFSIYLLEWITILSEILPKQKKEKSPAKVNKASLTDSSVFLIIMKIANTILSLTNLGDELVAIAQKPEN